MTRSGTVYTVGHGTLGEAELVVLLGEAGVEHVVDVRSYPTSRHSPQHSQDQLERSLPTGGITYSWDQRLGGRRRPNPASPNVALRNEAFRAYADHMGTPGFHDGLDALVELADTKAVAVMCAESVWWRCHRCLLSDALVLLRSVPVAHLFHDGPLVAHSPTPEARVADGQIVYDIGATAPLL